MNRGEPAAATEMTDDLLDSIAVAAQKDQIGTGARCRNEQGRASDIRIDEGQAGGVGDIGIRLRTAKAAGTGALGGGNQLHYLLPRKREKMKFWGNQLKSDANCLCETLTYRQSAVAIIPATDCVSSGNTADARIVNDQAAGFLPPIPCSCTSFVISVFPDVS